MEEEKEKLPSVNLTYISNWYNKFRDILIPAYVAEPIAGDTYLELVRQISAVISKSEKTSAKDEATDVLAHSIKDGIKGTVANYLIGREPTIEELKKFAHALAGNMMTLRLGQQLRPWEGNPTSHWALARICSAHRYTTPARKLRGAILTYNIMSGPAASYNVDTFCPRDRFYRMAKRIGVLEKREYRRMHPRELVGMYVMILIDAGSDITAIRWLEKASLNKRNNKLATERGVACRSCSRAAEELTCVFCPVSYSMCKFAVRYKPYMKGLCQYGHNGWMAGRGTGTCLSCQMNKWQNSQ